MTWDAYNRRKEALREILAIADRDRAASLTDLLDTVDPQHVVFADETAALFEIQMAWFQRLSGTIDRLTTDGGETPELVALAAWTECAAHLPGARALLDQHRDEPALAKAFAKERAFIASAAGVPRNHPDVLSHGERIITAARATPTRPVLVPEATAPVERPGLIARLRSVIAA